MGAVGVIRRVCLAIAVLALPLLALAAPAVPMVRVAGGPAPGSELRDDADPALLARLGRLAAKSAPTAAAPVGLLESPPIAALPGEPGIDRYGISNFVDLDAGAGVLDYACGNRSYDGHRGIDYFPWPFGWRAMAQGAFAVRAVAGGTLLETADGHYDRNCSFDSPDTPNYVAIQHDDGTIGLYLHLKSGSVTEKPLGDRIEAGEALGLVGSSGISTGPHVHLQLMAAGAGNVPILEPNSGACHDSASLWAAQPAYREPRLMLVTVHDAFPEFSRDCGAVEQPHFRRLFAAGDTVYVAGFYADQPADLTSTITVRHPDGRVLARFVDAPTEAGLGDADAYNASYWVYAVTLPADAEDGLWQAEISYQGRTLSQRFAVGAPIHAASGLWYDPAQSGHGFTLETIEQNGIESLLAVWFTYLDGAPRWLYGVGPIVDGHAVVPALIASGGEFPPTFDPAALSFADWGTLEFTFDAADHGSVSWHSDLSGYGDGTLPIERLATPADINDDDFDTGLRACLSGSWYAPEQSGHGLLLQVAEVNGQRTLLTTWYAYHDGAPFWLSGAGPIDGSSANVPLISTRGGQFPPAFDPAAVERTVWGTAHVEAVDANHLTLSWQTSQPGFENGSLDLVRLTTQLTAPCQ